MQTRHFLTHFDELSHRGPSVDYDGDKCARKSEHLQMCPCVCVCVCVRERVPEDNRSHLSPRFPEWPSLSCANRLAKEEKGPALMCCMWRIYWRAEPLNQWCRKCIIRRASHPPPTHTHTYTTGWPPHPQTTSLTRPRLPPLRDPDGRHTHTFTPIHIGFACMWNLSSHDTK